MLSFLRLILTVLLLLIALLTVFPAPTIFLWRLSIVAAEYGQWLLILPLTLLVWEGFSHSSNLTAYIAIGTCLGICLFLIPSYQAWCLARYLPIQLTESYGPAQMTVHPFSFSRLWLPDQHPPPQREILKYLSQDGTTLGLDFYSSVLTGSRPCVIVVHGGGWNSGDNHQLPSLNVALAAEGYHVAAINYRLAPKSTWPAQKLDVLAAISFLRQHAESLRIDPDRLVILGRSAGGQIALSTAYAAHDPGIKGCISLYAPTDITFAYRYGSETDILRSRSLVRQFMGGTPDEYPANYDDASPRSLVDGQSPPTLLIHGVKDELVWYLHAHRLQRVLLEAKRPVFLLEMPWATHAFDLNIDGPAGQLSTYTILWFLSVVTR